MPDGVLDILGQTTVPQIFNNLASFGFIDTMNILRKETVSDGAGGQIKTDAAPTLDQPIPCRVERRERDGYKTTVGDRLLAVTQYYVYVPCTFLGEAVSLNVNDRLQVLARGNVPERVFRIVSAVHDSGAFHKVLCEIEETA
jgi:hypothetical protein